MYKLERMLRFSDGFFCSISATYDAAAIKDGRSMLAMFLTVLYEIEGL